MLEDRSSSADASPLSTCVFCGINAVTPPLAAVIAGKLLFCGSSSATFADLSCGMLICIVLPLSAAVTGMV
ncbi:hypothetical protein D3C78_931350 [compost metagenome]